MTRLPHELRRQSMFSQAWDLRGPLISGRLEPPVDGARGVYQGAGLRLLYENASGRRVRLRFQSPRLAKGRDRLKGEVIMAGPDRGLRIQGRGTGDDGVTLRLVSAGLFRRRLALLDPAGHLVASIRRRAAHFDVDVVAAAFERARGHADKGAGLFRLYEAAIAMVLAARVEQDRRTRAGVAAAGAGAVAAGAGAAGGVAAHRAVERRHARRDEVVRAADVANVGPLWRPPGARQTDGPSVRSVAADVVGAETRARGR